MDITKFSIVQPFSNGYYFFHSISRFERMFYFFFYFLLKISENDENNSIVLKLWFVKLEAHGIKDFILLLIILSILLFGYIS
jgi:hypothetical protein